MAVGSSDLEPEKEATGEGVVEGSYPLVLGHQFSLAGDQCFLTLSLFVADRSVFCFFDM